MRNFFSLIIIVFLISSCSQKGYQNTVHSIDHGVASMLNIIVDPIDKQFKKLDTFVNKSVAESEGRKYKTKEQCNDEFHTCYSYCIKELRKQPTLQGQPNVVIFGAAKDYCNKQIRCRKDYGYN